MGAFTYKIIDSISKIEKSDWDSILADTLQGYEFYRTIEESKIKGFSFHYILISEEGKLVLITPLFISDFNLDIAVSGIAQKLIQAIRCLLPRFLIFKTLFCGSPISENGILGISRDVRDKNTLICELTKIMDEFCKNNRIPLIIFKDFLKQDAVLLEPLKSRGLFMVESYPTVVVDLGFSSFDDYLESLSRNTRKDLRRKIKKIKSSADIIVKAADNVEDVIEEIYPLYLNTRKASQVRFEKLTKEFFLNAGKFMPQSKFFLYYVDGKLAAFNFCLVCKNTLIDEFIGFDYPVAYKYNLYFYSWCYNIEWCLKNSIKYYRVGQIDYYPKLKLGGRLVPLYAFLKHNNPILNSVLSRFAKILAPASLDESIKKYRTR